MKFTMKDNGDVVAETPRARASFDASDRATIIAALRLFKSAFEDKDGAEIAAHYPDLFKVSKKDRDNVRPMPVGSDDIDELIARIGGINTRRELEWGIVPPEIRAFVEQVAQGNSEYDALSEQAETLLEGICRKCGATDADNGEGFDGLCGECADKAEKRGDEGFRDS